MKTSSPIDPIIPIPAVQTGNFDHSIMLMMANPAEQTPPPGVDDELDLVHIACTDHPDGSVTLEMETSGALEIKQWILGFGPEAKILSPPKLQDSIAEDIRKMQTVYGGSTPA